MLRYPSVFRHLGPLALVILSLLPLRLLGSHASSFDIWYECVDPATNTYVFEARFYRDCDGTNQPSSVTLDFTSPSGCAADFSVTIDSVDNSTSEVSLLCPAELPNSTCNGGTLPGFQQTLYRDTVTFPTACPDWTASYDLCCRNAAITNLDGNNDIYIDLTLDQSSGICNSSPQFTSLPTPFICINETFCYNHGTFDPDGDSLVYSLIDAREAAGVTHPYVAGRSGTDPLATASGSFNIDPETGQMCFTPTQTGQYVIVIQIDEYRNGVFLGTTMREMQIVVDNCSNQQPQLDNPGVVGNGDETVLDSVTVSACPGDNVDFSLSFSDPNAGDNITLNDNVGLAIPGASTTTSGSNPATLDFQWTPTATDTGVNAFTVEVFDDGCPILGSQFISVQIFVNDGVFAGPDTAYCDAGSPIGLSVFGGNSFVWSVLSGDGSSLSCTNCQFPDVTPSVTTTYRVEEPNLTTGCKVDDTISVAHVPDIVPNLPASPNVCSGDNELIDLQMSPSGQAPFTYDWGPNEDISSTTVEDPTVSPDDTTRYGVTVTSANGCIVTDSLDVFVQAVPDPLILADSTNPQCGTDLPLVARNGSSGGDDFESGGLTSNPFWADSSGLATSNCFANSGSNAVLMDIGSADRFLETTDQNVNGCASVDFCFFYNNTTDPGCVTDQPDNTEELQLEYSTDGGATWTNIQVFDYPTFPKDAWHCVSISIPPAAETPATRFRFLQETPNNDVDPIFLDDVAIQGCPDNSSNLGYSWSPSTGLSTTSGDSTVANIDADQTYTVTATNLDNTNCQATANISLTVEPLTLSVATDESAPCFGDTVNLSSSLTSGFNYSWSPTTGLNDPSINNPEAEINDTITYTLTATSTANPSCSANDAVTINPDSLAVQILADSTNPKCGTELPLVASNASTSGLSDNFDTGNWNTSLWADSAVASIVNCHSNSGSHSVMLSSTGSDPERFAETTDLDVTSCGSVDFSFYYNDAADPCSKTDPTDAGEELQFEYSTDGGATWVTVTTFDLATFPGDIWHSVSEAIPPAAQTSSTRFRFFQPSPSDDDPIWLDDVSIEGCPSSSNLGYSWAPATGLSTTSGDSTAATIDAAQTYTVTATDQNNTSCQGQASIDLTVQPLTVRAATDEAAPCFGDTVILSTDTLLNGFNYSWTPTTGLSDPSINNPEAEVNDTITYSVSMSSSSGLNCNANDNITINPENLAVTASVDNTPVCQGETVQLDAAQNTAGGGDDFESGGLTSNPFWADSSGLATSNCFANSGSNAVLMNIGSNDRFLETTDQNVNGCASIDFCFFYNENTDPSCVNDEPDNTEELQLEYSTDGGATWTNIQVFDYTAFPKDAWHCVSIPIPAGAETPSTRFRFLQETPSNDVDPIFLDDVSIEGCSGGGAGAPSFSWSPSGGVSDPSISDPTAQVFGDTDYIVTVTDGNNSSCFGEDTVPVAIDSSQFVTATPSSVLCTGSSTTLNATFNGSVGSGGESTDFSTGFDASFWANENGTQVVGCHSMLGDALHFIDGTADRFAESLDFDVSTCATMDFCFFYTGSTSHCGTVESPDGGEELQFEYSTDGGATWTNIQTFDEATFPEGTWHCESITLPPGAVTTSTRFRWFQATPTIDGGDSFYLDNITTTGCSGGTPSYSWSPTADLDDPSIQDPEFTMPGANSVTLTVTVTGGTCPVTDTVTMTNCTPPLAVEFLEVEAERQGEDALVRWSTAQEVQTSHFQVERAENLHGPFVPLGRRAARGGVRGASYRFLDETPQVGTNYYRIREVELDGATTLSRTVSVTFGNRDAYALDLFPNPADNLLNLRLRAPADGELNLVLYDAVGRRIRSLDASTTEGLNRLQLELNGLARGSYYLAITDGEQHLVGRRFIKR